MLRGGGAALKGCATRTGKPVKSRQEDAFPLTTSRSCEDVMLLRLWANNSTQIRQIQMRQMTAKSLRAVQKSMTMTFCAE